MKGGLMLIAILIFLWSQASVQTGSADNVVVSQPSSRLLVKHVVYLNGNETEQQRKSVESELKKGVAKDVSAYLLHGFDVKTDTWTQPTVMVIALMQVDHFEIQPPPIKPRE
jgi:hypothetical protein